MRYLLDTHAFLWFVLNDPQLSPTALALIRDSGNEIYLSVASTWEIAIKVSIGKLQIGPRLDQFLPQQLRQNGIVLLPITLEHTTAVSTLPLHHRDPFDRLLAAQSTATRMPIISVDAVLDPYGVQRIW